MTLWKSPLNRRALMQRFGQAAIVLPLLRVLEEHELMAATPETRAVFWYFPDGIIKSHFHPSSAASDAPLPAMLAPLQALREDCTFLRQVDYKTSGSHESGAAYCLTGDAKGQGASIDTVLGQRLGSSSQLPVLRLGIGANFQRNVSVSYAAPGVAAVVEDHPARAFYGIWGDAASGIDPATREKMLRGERSIIDLGKAQLRSLQEQLGTSEKQKLDLHLESLRELERRVQGAGKIAGERLPQCTEQVDMRGLSFPPGDYSYPSMEHRNEHFATIGDIITDIGLQALACGVTRVLFLQWSHPVSPTHFDFPGGTGISRGHHDISHYGGDPASGAAQEFIRCQSWYMGRLASLISRLKSMQVGDRSLLYHTSLLALTELADANLHDFTNVGLVMAGQASGRLRSGQCIDAGGASHNQVLVTLMRSLGQDVDTFGDPLLGRGAIAGLLS